VDWGRGFGQPAESIALSEALLRGFDLAPRTFARFAFDALAVSLVDAQPLSITTPWMRFMALRRAIAERDSRTS
jgi:hypothetical protein